MVRSPLALVLASLLGVACDGTLSGMHATRGVLPVVYPDPEPVAEPVELHLGEPAQIRAQHMLVMHSGSRNAPPTVVRTREEARERAEEALAKIKAGGNVDEIIGAYSDERGAAERAGDLGPFSRKMMVKKFSDAAFKLKVGEVSGIVESEFGFHIIRRTE
jgi:hypothetical protein